MVVIRVKLEIICKKFCIVPGTYLYLLSIIIVINNKNNNQQGAIKTVCNRAAQRTFWALSKCQAPFNGLFEKLSFNPFIQFNPCEVGHIVFPILWIRKVRRHVAGSLHDGPASWYSWTMQALHGASQGCAYLPWVNSKGCNFPLQRRLSPLMNFINQVAVLKKS